MGPFIFALLMTTSHGEVSEPVQGQILSIGGIERLVWIQGSHCPGGGSCEGVVYQDVRVATQNGEAQLPRLVLLNRETTDCEEFDPYWAVLALMEKFAPSPKGTLFDHKYSTIELSSLKAQPVNLSAITDKTIGFASSGPAHVGQMQVTVHFNQPFPENKHLASLCQDGSGGVQMIREKVLRFDY